MHFHRELKPDWVIPEGIEILFPFEQEETLAAMQAFYDKYYDDDRPRIGVYGINPGRFGAGVTGVPFTDPIRLEEELGIENEFKKRSELSSEFIYKVIEAWGGPESFYQTFFISSLSPLGFTRSGKNYNYYDSRDMKAAVEPYIVDHLQQHLEWKVASKAALCLGRGKNSTVFEDLNEEHDFFDHLLILPHPRWVMQYRRKRMQEYLDLYLEKLRRSVELVID